jgi:hypothetical protein
MNTKMISDMNFTYGGRRLKPGDEFTATSRDATALAAYSRAHLASDTSSENVGEAAAAVLAAARKPRRYRRRDMRAESAQSAESTES